MFAQNEDTTGVSIEYFLENIDLSTVPSGLLYEAALPIVHLPSYNGINTDESRRLDKMGFRSLYATLYGSAVTEASRLPEPEIGLTHQGDSDVISYKAILYQYHRLREDAVDAGILTITDDQQDYVPGNTYRAGRRGWHNARSGL